MGRRRRGRAKRTGNLKAATVPVFRVSEECKQVHQQIYFSEGVPSKKCLQIIQGRRRVCYRISTRLNRSHFAVAAPHCTLHPTSASASVHRHGFALSRPLLGMYSSPPELIMRLLYCDMTCAQYLYCNGVYYCLRSLPTAHACRLYRATVDIRSTR